MFILSQEASKQLALSVVTGDKLGQPHVSLSPQCEQHKTWWWPENEAMYSNLWLHVSEYSQ